MKSWPRAAAANPDRCSRFRATWISYAWRFPADGASFAAAMRERGLNELPMILLTARCDQECLADLVERYNVRVYPKPFVPSKFVAEVERMLGAEHGRYPSAAFQK